MNDTFDVVNQMFNLFMASAELASALGIASNATVADYDNKMRRVAADATLLDPNDTTLWPFFDYSWIPAVGQQKNHLTFKGVLEFNIWTSQMYDAEVIYRILKEILKSAYDDADMVYSAAVSSGIPNIYRYRMRLAIVVSS